MSSPSSALTRGGRWFAIPLVVWLGPMGLIGFRAAAEPLANGATNSATVAPAPAQPQSTGTATDQVVADWMDRVAREPSNATAWLELGDALMQQSREGPEPEMYDRAEQAFRQSLSLAQDNPGAMVGLAWVHNSRHEFDEGTQWAKRAIAADLAAHDAHALLGDAAVELGDYDAAFAHYQKAMDLHPDLSSYSRAAHLLWVTGDARRARRLMQRAIDAGGPYAENIAWCRAELARMLLHGGALLLAEREADKALRLAPENYHVLATMGEINTAKQEYSAAIDYYRRAVAVTPDPDALVALGDLYAMTGQRQTAEESYERVVSILSSGGFGHDHGGSYGHAQSHGSARLARFYADHDRNLVDALREAELAYGDFPNVFVTDTLAWCLYKNGRYDDARKTIDEALKWKTPDANILFHAGMIYARLGDRPMAQTYLYRALSLNPRFHIQNAEVAVQTLATLSAPPEHTQRTEVSLDRTTAVDRGH